MSEMLHPSRERIQAPMMAALVWRTGLLMIAQNVAALMSTSLTRGSMKAHPFMSKTTGSQKGTKRHCTGQAEQLKSDKSRHAGCRTWGC